MANSPDDPLEAAYAQACWEWLRKERKAPPDPAMFTLDPNVAQVIAVQVYISYKWHKEKEPPKS